MVYLIGGTFSGRQQTAGMDILQTITIKGGTT